MPRGLSCCFCCCYCNSYETRGAAAKNAPALPHLVYMPLHTLVHSSCCLDDIYLYDVVKLQSTEYVAFMITWSKNKASSGHHSCMLCVVTRISIQNFRHSLSVCMFLKDFTINSPCLMIDIQYRLILNWFMIGQYYTHNYISNFPNIFIICKVKVITIVCYCFSKLDI